jgi:hypothetical protein
MSPMLAGPITPHTTTSSDGDMQALSGDTFAGTVRKDDMEDMMSVLAAFLFSRLMERLR